MDSTVIKKLADIDLAARSILADAEKEQGKLAEEYRAKTEAYDRELDRQSERELKEIRNKLERENAEAIARLEADMETSLAFIEKNYAEQADLRADEIVGRILEYQDPCDAEKLHNGGRIPGNRIAA